MIGLKGRALLLVLGVPFALYAAWQVNGVARADLVASDPPADRGAPKDQLAAARAKSAAWAADARKAVGVAWKYQPAGPDDATPDNAPAAGVTQAAAARTAELSDLDRFLSGAELRGPPGTLRASYAKWKSDFDQAAKAEQEVKDWFVKLLRFTSADDAVEAMSAADGLIKAYAGSKFADKKRAAQWRVEARLAVIDALAALADAQYRAAVKVKLPLGPGNAVTAAVDTLGGLEAQIAALNADLKRALEDKMPVEPAVRGAVEAKGAVADQCAASKELLTLFVNADLSKNPGGAAAWLAQVVQQYNRTKDEKVKALIRDKVQEFCEAFVPAAVRLDDKVLFKGNRVPREDITVEYEPVAGAKAVSAVLADDTNGLNEFNLADRHPGRATQVRYKGAPGKTVDLAPTDQSAAAVRYNTERAKVGSGITGPKWTAKSVDELKKKCDAQSELVNRLKAPGTGIAGVELKIGIRLGSLADGLKSAADLIDRAP